MARTASVAASVLVLLAWAAAVPICSMGMFVDVASVMTSSRSLAPCLRACGVSFAEYNAGQFPSDAQWQRFSVTPDCQAFYAELKSTFAALDECIVPTANGPLNLHHLENVPIETLLRLTYPIAHPNYTQTNATAPPLHAASWATRHLLDTGLVVAIVMLVLPLG
ncbi:hypothetical protein SPRG_16055 [Saprolegnia parasitica CBS 223.65]|uniref:Elicitin n=1 Tax=Saprolegnia parasitica (strain CBS 223.65) TaxID=695850 RepID=A0A067BPE0_SAPPC|nr:hypothetical protein SPRG_16055 [Saprolegnia parasitica CBS 223.65]KDO18625.1 hypothetical protein SPRG_16055 [Saprolegnia parasitica CBS 223.65]|eukprot:XP_012210671.1 hypothetical protein SPRG_16055 [Saprolegnia parasitica CBS 223.65]